MKLNLFGRRRTFGENAGVVGLRRLMMYLNSRTRRRSAAAMMHAKPMHNRTVSVVLLIASFSLRFVVGSGTQRQTSRWSKSHPEKINIIISNTGKGDVKLCKNGTMEIATISRVRTATAALRHHRVRHCRASSCGHSSRRALNADAIDSAIRWRGSSSCFARPARRLEPPAGMRVEWRMTSSGPLARPIRFLRVVKLKRSAKFGL